LNLASLVHPVSVQDYLAPPPARLKLSGKLRPCRRNSPVISVPAALRRDETKRRQDKEQAIDS
jgi:hypothetical protein